MRFKLRTLFVVVFSVAVVVTAWALIEPAIRNFEPEQVWIRDGRVVLIDYGTVGRNYNPGGVGVYVRERTIAIPIWAVAIFATAFVVALVIAVRKLKQKILSASH